MSVPGQLAAAAATVAAVVVALWVAIRDGRQQRAELADRQAAQARLVTAYVDRLQGRWCVRTANHSTAPVYDVEVEEVRHQQWVGNVEPVPGSPAKLRELLPGAPVDRPLAGEVGGDPASAVVVFRFVDAAGLRWRREGTGPPQRLVN